MGEDFDYDVFLSFCSDDEGIARPMWEELSHGGLRVFWSEATLKERLGELWPDTIQSSLERSRHLLLIGTRSSMSSKWVTFEWQAFFNNYYKPGHRRLITALVGDYTVSQLPLLLRQLQAVRLDERGSLEAIIPLLGGTNVNELRNRLLQKEQENRFLHQRLQAMTSELSSVKQKLDSKERDGVRAGIVEPGTIQENLANTRASGHIPATWAAAPKIVETSLPGVLLMKPRFFEDLAVSSWKPTARTLWLPGYHGSVRAGQSFALFPWGAARIALSTPQTSS